jgi:membrane protein YqaA with SNARE-associated domain
MNNLYLMLFLDSLWGSVAFTPSQELDIYAMFSFGNFPLFLVIPIALTGSMLGLAINWGIGRMLVDIFQLQLKPSPVEGKSGFDLFCEKAGRYGKWLLPVAPWLGIFLSPITLMAGIVKLRMPQFLVLTFIGKAVFYIYALLVFQGMVPDLSIENLIYLALSAVE